MRRIFVLSIFIAMAMSSISFAQSADVNQNATDVNGNISADVENQINSFPTCGPTNTLCHVFGIDLKIKLDQFTSAIGVTPPETVAEDLLIANYEREKELVQLQNMEQAGNISAAAAQPAYNSLQSDIQNDNQSLNNELAAIQQANPQEDVGALQNVQTAEQGTDSQINTDQSQIVAEQTVSTSSETTSEQPSSTATETSNTENPETATSSTFSENSTVNETASETNNSTGNISIETNNSSVSGLVGIVQSVENITGNIINSVDNVTIGIIRSIENITQMTTETTTATETTTQAATEVTAMVDNSPTDNGAAISGEAALVQVKNLTSVGPVVKNRNSRLEVFQAAMQKKVAELNASKTAVKPSGTSSNKRAAPTTKSNTPSTNRK